MRRALWSLSVLVSMALTTSVVTAAPPPVNTGTLTLDNTPVYHGVAAFSWQIDRKPRYATLGVFCRQGDRWVYIAELSVPQTGSAGVVIDNTVSSAVPGHIDYSQPSDCQAYVWDERLVAQNKPAVLTNQVFFTIAP